MCELCFAPRIDEDVQPDLAEDAGLTYRNSAVHLIKHPLGEVVTRDLVGRNQLGHGRGHAEVPSDIALDKAGLRKLVGADLALVTQTSGLAHRQVARHALD
jgi:hypothetical protein